MLPQDLHIHTTYSYGDSAVVEQQTVKLIALIRHARIIGISDHFEYLNEGAFDTYEKEVREYGLLVGTEVSGYPLVREAARRNFDYYVYHCSEPEDYRALDLLVATGRPVIIAHPLIMGTDLDRIPAECYIEVNNRYVWRSDWRKGFRSYLDRFRFVISSDAHQPHWLNQNIARHVCRQLGITETLLFRENVAVSDST